MFYICGFFSSKLSKFQGKEPKEHVFLPPQQENNGPSINTARLCKDELDNKLGDDEEPLLPEDHVEENQDEKDEGFEDERIASPCVLINIQQV